MLRVNHSSNIFLAVRRKFGRFFFFREITPRRWRVSSCNLKDGRMVGRRMIIVDMFLTVEISQRRCWMRFAEILVLVFCFLRELVLDRCILHKLLPPKTSKNPHGLSRKKHSFVDCEGFANWKTHQFLLATQAFFFFWGGGYFLMAGQSKAPLNVLNTTLPPKKKQQQGFIEDFFHLD